MDVLYFGWIGRVHCPSLWDSKQRIVALSALPADVRERIDGGFCPGSYLLDGKVLIAPPEKQIEGKVRVYHQSDWTIVACWDRSAEPRHGTHSTFLMPGWWEPHPAMLRAQQAFPDVWARLPAVLDVEVP